MGARGGVEWEKKTNDALPGSWRIDYDGLAPFPSYMLSLFFCLSFSPALRLFPWLALLAMPVLSYKRNFWSMISYMSFQKKKKKWQLPCQRDILHERRDKYTFINRTQKCSWKHTHTLAQKINHGQKNERHLCSSTQKWQSVHLQPSNPKQLSVNLWRPQCLPITWQR